MVLLVVLAPHVRHRRKQDLRVRVGDSGGDDRAGAARVRPRSGASTSAYGVQVDWHDPRVRHVFALMPPVTLGLGIVNLDAADQLGLRQRSSTPNDQRRARSTTRFVIYMLPQGVFSVAVATVLFPALSRMAARRDAVRHAPRGGQRHAPDQPDADTGGCVHDRAARTPIVNVLSPARRGTQRGARPTLASIALFWFAFSLPVRRPQPAAHAHLLRRSAPVDSRPRLAAMNIVVDVDRQRRPRTSRWASPGLVIGTVVANIVMTGLQLQRPARRPQRPPRSARRR